MVLDIKMPRLDGVSLLVDLSNPPPVVVVSAYPFDGEAHQHAERIVSHLTKPVAPEHLLDAVAFATRKAKHT